MNRWQVKDAVMRADCPLTPTQRFVMIALVLRADASTGRIPRRMSPTIDDLHDDTGYATSTVREALAALAQTGWIATHRRSRRAPIEYDLRYPSAPITGALSEPTTGGLSPPTTGGLGGASPPTTGALSAPTAVPSPPTTGAQSADHRRTSTSSSRDSAAASRAAAQSSAGPRTEHQRAVADIVRRLDVSHDSATLALTYLLGGRSGSVRSIRGLVRSIPDEELREHVVDGHREEPQRPEPGVSDDVARRHFCVTCEAEPGELCQELATGRPTQTVHNPRRRLALDEAARPAAGS